MKEQNILIVDDEKAIRKLFRSALELKGYTVFSAESAEDAVQILEENDIPVLFLDLNLPGMNGIDLCRQVLKTKPETIAYAVTGYTSSYKSSECMEAGFKDYFTKPVSLLKIFNAAHEAFNNS